MNNKMIKVMQGCDGQKVFTYCGRFSPYDIGLTIGEIIQGLPDLQTARMCLTDIMAALADYEDGKQEGRIVHIPFSSGGLLTASEGYITLSARADGGGSVEVSGKMCIFACTEEEAARHDAAATQFINANGGNDNET